MKKTKIISLALILLCAALLLCACGGKSGAAPEASPTVEPEPTLSYDGMLQISEIMIKNRATLRSADGSFPDWVELENISDDSIELEGWALSDGDSSWCFPAKSIAPGDFLIVYADELESNADEFHTGFALSAGETLYLYAPDGTEADSVYCEDGEADSSIARSEAGFTHSNWPSPGFENSTAGYDSFAGTHNASGPIIINEVTVYTGEDSEDWIEIKNISDETVPLQDYFISDDHKDYQRQALPNRGIMPGEILVFYCAGDEADPMNDFDLGFSLSADREYLYLSHRDAGLIDYAPLHDIPLNASIGKMPGENGFFYFSQPSPAAENAGGMRRVSAAPVSGSPEGIFDAGSNIKLEIEAMGEIRYTTDGSYPNAESALYTGPVSIDQTCVVRAVSYEDGAIPSRPLTMSYIVGEGHSLPVISLVLDNISHFNDTYNSMLKDVYMPSCVAFFDENGGFKKDCFTSLKGWTSLVLPKKSLGVSFESVLDGDLEYDVFGNGISTYSDLSIRAGQDYEHAVIRTELFQELCYEMGGPVLNQESQYCVLYINGEYRGLYCLKEDFSKQYFASHAGVSKASVEKFRAPSGPEVDFFYDVFMYCWHQDMSLKENYDFVCSKVDIDSLIDWFIIEGFSGNTDTQGNLRFFRSAEDSNKWMFALYDLDWGFINPYNAYTLLINGGGNVGGEIPTIMWGLLNNAEFRDKLIGRFAELNKTVLSNENVLKKIDELAAIVEPEIARDRERWGLETEKWYEEIETLRNFVVDNNYEQLCLDSFCRNIKVTAEEYAKHFGE